MFSFNKFTGQKDKKKRGGKISFGKLNLPLKKHCCGSSEKQEKCTKKWQRLLVAQGLIGNLKLLVRKKVGANCKNDDFLIKSKNGKTTECFLKPELGFGRTA